MILLNSVGTALTRQLNTHPILEDGTIDRDEGTTTHVYDLDNEWFCNLSDTDLLEFFDFIEETQELGLKKFPKADKRNLNNGSTQIGQI